MSSNEPLEGWFKSTFSAPDGHDCVEVNLDNVGTTDTVLLRDSKNPDVPPLRFTGAEWRAFLLGAKDNEFDI